MRRVARNQKSERELGGSQSRRHPVDIWYRGAFIETHEVSTERKGVPR